MSPFILAFAGLPGGAEWVVIAIVGLLIFGRRLPEVGRNIGRSLGQFKRGLHDITDEVHTAADTGPDAPALPRDDLDAEVEQLDEDPNPPQADTTAPDPAADGPQVRP